MADLASFACKAFPGARVVGQTNTAASHERLRTLGITPRTKADAAPERFSHVIFCAPPSGSDNYPAEARAAVHRICASHALR